MFKQFAFFAAAAALVSGCACGGGHRADDDARHAELHRAHDNFVSAINSNDLEAFLATLTDDVVLMPPNSQRVVGKDAVRPWVDGYLDAYSTHWDKTTLELLVSGDWASEQYAYRSTDTPRGGGRAIHDQGKGLIIYRREPDGVWRVARDAWNSDLPLPG